MFRENQKKCKLIIAVLGLLSLFEITKSSSLCPPASISSPNALEPSQQGVCSDVFYYFAYGSNMLTSRIHKGLPTAVSLGPAFLKDYRFEFAEPNFRWGGTRSTVVPEKNATAYGVLWVIDKALMDLLDRQECIPERIYFKTIVPATLVSNGSVVNALTYRLTDKPELSPLADIRPSRSYLRCIVKGAQEAGLPSEYIRFLKRFNHTEESRPQIEEEFSLADVDLDDWL